MSIDEHFHMAAATRSAVRVPVFEQTFFIGVENLLTPPPLTGDSGVTGEVDAKIWKYGICAEETASEKDCA